ncbi:MAG TPA: CHAD domain-containing protein, partial [Puia sp.]|nr:CHAD domain-containing protein [Puia sp.]
MPVQNKDIIHYINAQFEKLRDLAGKATKKFDKTQIHHFRVRVKKLRAFLRLLQSNPSQKKKLRIP